ncbi:MAG: hypothetical protein HYX92_02185 [Chloroflexi bacterium]|nr:hypothetical protein [Chloroflexota bacterium]
MVMEGDTGNQPLTAREALAKTVQAFTGIDESVRNLARDRVQTARLTKTPKMAHPELLLFYVIKKSAEGLSFDSYKAYMDYLFCGDTRGLENIGRDALGADDQVDEAALAERAKRLDDEAKEIGTRRFLPYTDADAYRVLKVATEAFLSVNCAVPLSKDGPLGKLLNETDVAALIAQLSLSGDAKGVIDGFWNGYLKAVNGDSNLTVPYLSLIQRKLGDLPLIQRVVGKEIGPELCYGILTDKLTRPCLIELIWSYWHEQGMLVQTMNAITRRFQNVRGPVEQDPLAMIEIDPLRPLNNLLWGYIQDEQHRLSLVRRAYEYDHHYGLTLEGKAVPKVRGADSRRRFIEAFHNLLYLVSVFYKQDDDNTVDADAFPVLKVLEDLHLLLSEGAHNQFGDLPTTARIEMLMQEWLLARPEFREVLPRRTMVAYPEAWMDSVDVMKRLQGWTDTSVLHFRHLGVYGEQILLSIRYGNWSNISEPHRAAIWARLFRSEIQGYIHAYQTVTGVDLTAATTTVQQRELVTTDPSVLLRLRAAGRQGTPAPLVGAAPAPVGFRQRRAAQSMPAGGR